MRRRIGEVWFLPPESAPGGDDKARRHVLLTDVDESAEGILAYASTRTTEAAFGAVSLYVDPAASPDCGFAKPTRVYPCRLVPAEPVDFLRRTGRLLHELPHLKRVQRIALGSGTGGAASGSSSWRGKVVRLNESIREIIRYPFGVVLTEHHYSARRRYQIIVPLGNAAEILPDEGDLLVADVPWLSVLSPDLAEAVLSVSEIHSVFHPREIDSWTGAVIDDGTLGEIEVRLKDLFDL